MKTGYLQGAALSLTAAMVAGCFGDNLGPATTAIATIEDGEPADGCSIVITVYPVHLAREQYVPDEQSARAIRNGNLPLQTPVTITYRLTGDTGRATCGFGTHLDLPEIAILFHP